MAEDSTIAEAAAAGALDAASEGAFLTDPELSGIGRHMPGRAMAMLTGFFRKATAVKQASVARFQSHLPDVTAPFRRNDLLTLVLGVGVGVITSTALFLAIAHKFIRKRPKAHGHRVVLEIVYAAVSLRCGVCSCALVCVYAICVNACHVLFLHIRARGHYGCASM